MATDSEVRGEEEVDCDMCEECGKFIIDREVLLDNAPERIPRSEKMTSSTPTPEAVLIQMVHQRMEAEKAREKPKKAPIVMTPPTQSPMLLFDGKTVRRQFQPEETLAMVREWIEKHHPRTVFTED